MQFYLSFTLQALLTLPPGLSVFYSYREINKDTDETRFLLHPSGEWGQGNLHIRVS